MRTILSSQRITSFYLYQKMWTVCTRVRFFLENDAAFPFHTTNLIQRAYSMKFKIKQHSSHTYISVELPTILISPEHILINITCGDVLDNFYFLSSFLGQSILIRKCILNSGTTFAILAASRIESVELSRPFFILKK